jgi:hypothetical protein
MEYKSLVKDFARRTQKNLDQVRILKANGLESYEVTALINSMLGLLIFPQQKYIDEIPETPLEKLAELGWPIPKVTGDFHQVKNLRQLIRHLRNAISHFNINFFSDDSSEIAGLYVWNVHPHTKEITWEAKLSISDLDMISNNFIKLILSDK